MLMSSPCLRVVCGWLAVGPSSRRCVSCVHPSPSQRSHVARSRLLQHACRTRRSGGSAGRIHGRRYRQCVSRSGPHRTPKRHHQTQHRQSSKQTTQPQRMEGGQAIDGGVESSPSGSLCFCAVSCSVCERPPLCRCRRFSFAHSPTHCALCRPNSQHQRELVQHIDRTIIGRHLTLFRGSYVQNQIAPSP